MRGQAILGVGAILGGVSALITALCVLRAPLGWQDEGGFHFGESVGQWLDETRDQDCA